MIFLVILLIRRPSDKLMVSPFILVHPSKEYKQKAYQGFFIYRELFFELVQTSDNLVGNVNDISWLMCFPIVRFVPFANKKFDVVYEACKNFLRFSIMIN